MATKDNEERKTVAEMASEFLREGGVLILVFAWIEPALAHRSLEMGTMICALVMSAAFLVEGFALERWRF